MTDLSTEYEHDERWRELRAGTMANYDFDTLRLAAQEYLDPWTAGSIMRYVMSGIDPGHFLTCVLANDLVHSFGQADENNTQRMRVFAMFLYNEMPMGCWGSYETVRHWMRNGGVLGFRKQLKEEYDEECEQPAWQQGDPTGTVA